LGSVFDMTEAKILGSPDKIEDEELENELELDEKLNSDPGSPLKILAKKPKDDEFKILHEGERADPHEIIEDGFVDMARVTVGASFGELALIDGKPRMATIKCLTRCHFLVLNRQDYIKSLKDQERKRKYDRVSVIRKIPLFNKLTKTWIMNKLTAHFFDMNTIRGQFLFK
jgi:hypothetical protein